MTDGCRLTGASKIVSAPEAQERAAEWRRAGKTVAYTNGCFDVIHAGHVRTLAFARGQADALVVGINSDDSARRLKGSGRPIMPEQERAEILAALACVDLVVIFPELSSLPTIQALRPEVWVKGGDYDLSTVHQEERTLVESYGGRVAIADRVGGVSTTEIIARIRCLPEG
jgi:D-beta-D-heptose 7-phosphate kinase/D-beta-D-heptose 1-phosphate adenosyltransferase